jgi:hypothetical protein
MANRSAETQLRLACYPIEELPIKDYIAFALFLSFSVPCSAALAARPVAAQPEQTAPSAAAAYLGVEVGYLPPALTAHLSPSVPKGQGVVIRRVEPGSPAAATGLQPHDLLLSYDDQRLYSPEQLAKLVAVDVPGRTVALKLERAGQIQTVQATLGEGKSLPMTAYPWQVWPFAVPYQFPPAQEIPEGVAESFESLRIEKLDGDRYRAAIEYLDAGGETRSFSFEGTRKELRKQIAEAKELPAPVRDQLLNALNAGEGVPLPSVWGFADFEDFL